MSRSAGLVALIVASVASARPPETDPAKPRARSVTLSGTVVTLPEALKSTGFAFDAEPVARQVVVKGADGAVTPLLSDDASRALFLDVRLRNRPVEVDGRRLPGNPYLQVISFRVAEDGKLRTPEYYCEVCTISVRYPQICPCCQAEMVLRMKPEPR